MNLTLRFLSMLGAAGGVHAQVYVSNLSGHSVFAYDEITGQRIGTGPLIPAGTGGLNQPHGLLPWDREYLLVASFGDDTVKVFYKTTGQFHRNLITSFEGIDNPVQLKIGPDQLIYLSSQGNHRILRFNQSTGASADASPFISGGQLAAPSGFGWSPDKSVLYVAGRMSGNVLAYSAATGAPLVSGHVVASGLPAGSTFGLAVAPGGDVFVAAGNQVRRYSPAGELRATITLSAIGLDLSADRTGVLAASGGTVRRINLADNVVVAASQITPLPGSLNFFHWPGRVTRTAPFTVEEGGQRYVAMEFQITKWSPGQTRIQFSTDLFTWSDAVVYSPMGTGYIRSAPTLTELLSVEDFGDRIIVAERDSQPIGANHRRFYRVPEG